MTNQTNEISSKTSDKRIKSDSYLEIKQPTTLRRIDRDYIFSEIGSVLNLDKGIFYTIRELLIRPGKSIRTFIHEDRKRLMKPIFYVIICSLAYTILQQTLKFEDGYMGYSQGEGTTSAIFNWISSNYGYANILVSVFIALWIRLFFLKSGYNIFEILTLLCFVVGTGMLIFAFFGSINSFITYSIIDKGYGIGVLYIAWGIDQFFRGNKIINSLKGFACYILGLTSFAIIVLIIGFLIDG